MKRFTLLVAIIAAISSCKTSNSSQKKNSNPALTTTYTPQPIDQTATPLATNSLVGGRFVQAKPCLEGFFAKILQLFNSVCVSEVTFSGASSVTLVINKISLTSIYSLVSSVISIDLKNATRVDGGKSFGLGSADFTAAADFRSLTDSKNRILNRQN